MNMKNLVVAITSITILGLFTALESAAAQTTAPTVVRRTGNTYSKAGIDGQNLNAQFGLVNATQDGQLITDLVANKQVGLFTGAIENYATGTGLVCTIPRRNEPQCANGIEGTVPGYLYSEDGFPILLTSFDATTTPFTGNLLVEFFQAGKDPLFPSAPERFSAAAIAFSILKSGENSPVSIYRLQELADLDLEQSVNNLTYIIENDLFSRAAPIDVSRPAFVGGQVFAQNRIDEQTAAIPEPGITLGTLVALGMGTWLKRKTTQRD